MPRLTHSDGRGLPTIIMILAFGIYLAVFALYHDRMGDGIGALAILPVIGASWYFGALGGVLTAGVAMLASAIFLILQGHSPLEIVNSPGDLSGALALILTGLIVGRLSTLSREHRNAIQRLEKFEQDRQAQMRFLEQLQAVTGRALEADNLQATLEIVSEQTALLFQADDAFFSLWDADRDVPVPTAAYGSTRDVYPRIEYGPGDRTPGAYALEQGSPVAIADLHSSPHVDRHIAALFPSRSMLVIPLVAQSRRLGALLLGYRNRHAFTQTEMDRARAAAGQIALVLAKSLVLEEERKQVRQLTALHDIALISIAVEDEDDLINRVTDVIGQNLFPDNFGILLLDEQSGTLRAHPSYRFFLDESRRGIHVALDQGIAGQVARTGQAQRIGNVREAPAYLNVDEQTMSELCVPIKFRERVLGVINAESTKKDAFSGDDERLLITLAGQLATALEQIRKGQAERKWLDQLAHSNDLIYALAQITTHIERAFSTDDIIRNLGAELNKIDLTCIMAVYDRERGLFTVNYTSMEVGALERVEEDLGVPLIRNTFSRDRLNLQNIQYPTALPSLEDEIQLLFPRSGRGGISELLRRIGLSPGLVPLRLPLVFEDNLLGILWIWGEGLAQADLPVMSIFAKQIGVSLERARLFQEVQSLALTDPLTGLQNRRSLFELGRVEFARAQRMGRPFCCMMLDLDHFKHINDSFGHLVGDQVLKEVADRCQALVREVDLIGRFGGEELIVLLSETDRRTSMQVAERLRRVIAATPIRVLGEEISVTVSIGVAAQDENTTELETLIARADQAMYIAKHKGRNRVAMSR